MKAYFINLDRSPERLDYMVRTLDGLGLDHERVAAVDGRGLTQEEIHRAYTPAPGDKRIDNGTIACFMSHRRVWQRIAEESDPFALVLEDDELFGENAREILGNTDWVPASADLIRLETVRRHTVWDRRPITSVLGRDIVRLRHVHLGAGAYIVSRKAAAALHARTEPFRFAVDYTLFEPRCADFCGFDVLQMAPALCIQSAVAPKQAQTVELPSILHQTRNANFVKGLPRLRQKAVREWEKRKLLLKGLLFDRLTGRKTARIPFR
ncbi:MAG: glycosyltransferase family 25 protein [Oricola sp.]